MDLTSLYVEPETPAVEIDWPALEFRDVFRIFAEGPTETVALRGLTLRVERGEIVAVLGPSGSGKSTFLALAAGLDQSSAGEVRSFGRPLGRLSDGELAAYRASQLAIIFQSNNLLPSLTAFENVELALRVAGREQSAQAASEALEQFGLGSRGGQRVSSMSGGEQQRVAIAAAAGRRAPLVLADEPTGELDRSNERVVLDSLLDLRARYDATVVVVTHSREVAAMADRTIELRDGIVA